MPGPPTSNLTAIWAAITLDTATLFDKVQKWDYVTLTVLITLCSATQKRALPLAWELRNSVEKAAK
jgi:hypothetical protein